MDGTVTKKILAGALRELLVERPFGSITVGDIAARSHVSRTTFYNHFKDKYELGVWLHKDITSRAICGADETMLSWRDRNRACLQAEFDNRDIIIPLRRYDDVNSIVHYDIGCCVNMCRDAWLAREGAEVPADLDYIILGYAHSLGWITQEWARRGMDLSPEQMAQIQYDATPAVIQELFENRPYITEAIASMEDVFEGKEGLGT